VHWNEYRGPYFTIRAGAGFLVDFAAYVQNAQSKEQIAVTPGEAIRDFRFVLSGSLPKFNRPVTWCAGIMYDAASTKTWLIRMTGVMVAIPELWGYLFVGRQKEGFSLNKVMTGYDGWTMERSTMNDATIPILADGVKWLGYSPKYGFIWNLGWYNDFLSKTQAFNTYHNQSVARLMWLPIHSEEKGTLLHLGVNLRYGSPEGGQIRMRSRPEVFPDAPYFVDTGSFPAAATRMAGPEIYYRNKNWLFGTEYWFVGTSAPSKGDPTFQGGDAVVAWVITGETRAYNTVGGFFREIEPRRTVFQGGPGAWELVFRESYIDLDSRAVHGGEFRRFTPAVNWYLSDNVRLEFVYGYGHLDRFGVHGNTQFFQTRVQLQF
jgi:phosphate-selective porin OprO/OprP